MSRETTTESTSGGGPAPRRGSRIWRWLRRGLLGLLVLLLLVVTGAAVWVYVQLRGSLPVNDGEVTVAALAAPVQVARDGLGIPTVRAASRADAAAALGFLHAQERFFQMDLMRRQAAGELSAVVGSAVVNADKRFRVHRFRHRAEAVLAAASAQQRELLEAYAGGVNAGLEALGKPSFEYLLLGTEPQPWRPSDSIMVIYAMFMMLQDEDGAYESMLGILDDTLPPQVAAFLTPEATRWDVPILPGEVAMPPLPGADVVDLRRAALPLPAVPEGAAPEGSETEGSERESEKAARLVPALPWPLRSPVFTASPEAEARQVAASNAWAVAAEHAAGGRALLAADMHIGLALPNIWYRASLQWSDGGGEHRLDGVSVPGLPLVVVGSNGHVAWAFTSGRADTSDLVVLEPGPTEGTYLTADGPRPYERFTESIEVNGGEPVERVVEETVWGPVVGEDHLGRRRALAWVAYDAAATDLGLLAMESAGNVDEALAAARAAGVPAMNILLADADGRIGWALAGAVPRRLGFSGRVPVSWAGGEQRWDGFLADDEVPVVADPEGGRLWSGNNRMTGGEELARLGDGNYTPAARARQARDRLVTLDAATADDLLALQLDDRALFYQRWHDLLAATLAGSEEPRRREMAGFVDSWGGRAAADSVGYLLVRDFRQEVAERALAPLLAPPLAVDPELDYLEGYFRSEEPLWQLVEARPAHLLDPAYADWDALFADAVAGVLERVDEDGLPLAERTWGWKNETAIRHLFAGALPVGQGLLSMPALRLPGDELMPRVQGPAFGASQRMVVSPGHEDEAIFHMPGGQSGHPLSDHFGDSNPAWAEGLPTPLWPGETVDELTLRPAEGGR